MCKEKKRKSNSIRMIIMDLPDSERGGQWQNCILHFHCQKHITRLFLFIILLWLVGIRISMATLTLGNTGNIPEY